MTKYYTVALATPTVNRRSYYARYLYEKPASGFLFYDDDSSGIDIADVQKALFSLRDLFEGPVSAFATEVDGNTIFASFSLSSIPVPIKEFSPPYMQQEPTEYLSSSGIEGWLIEDVTNPKTLLKRMNFSDIYDNCSEIFRLTGDCPCEKSKTNECRELNLVPNYPWLAGKYHSDFLLDHTVLNRKAYENVNGFEYVSSKKTIIDDFGKTFRPWDNHDFSLVPDRALVLSARAKGKHTRDKYRRESCATCVFGQKTTKGYDDCGDIRKCSGAVSEADAWIVIYKWYNGTGFEDIAGFTPLERDYLILKAGEKVYTKLRTTRAIECVLGGFRYYGPNDWRFRVSANRGELDRFIDFDNYAQLREAIPSLPETHNVPSRPSAKLKLACAVYGKNSSRYRPYTGACVVHTVNVAGDTVSMRLVNSRYTVGSWELNSLTSPVENFYQALPELSFGDAAYKLRQS